MDEPPTLEGLARRAVDGDRDAVANIVRGLQSNIYALALRMLWHPQDAEDATQEILVRVVRGSPSLISGVACGPGPIVWPPTTCLTSRRAASNVRS